MTTHRIPSPTADELPVTGTDREEPTITSHPIPLYSESERCACGAVAGPDGACRKCRARARWTRRRAERLRRDARPDFRPDSRGRTDDGPDPARPRGRRPRR